MDAAIAADARDGGAVAMAAAADDENDGCKCAIRSISTHIV
jgi:hypothetical protein